MKKINRALYGPSMTDVVLGAILSITLGIVLGMAYLVFKPVLALKDMPKERPPTDVVYFVWGSRGGANYSLLTAKRKIFTSGASVTVSEDELNTFVNFGKPTTPAKAPVPKPGTKPAANAPAADASAVSVSLYAPGTPNFRIREGEMQVVVPVKISAFGFEQEVFVQTRGTFVKSENGYAYDPAKLWVGSCPAGRLPGVTAWVMRKFLLSVPVPEDIAAAWAKVQDVAIVGSSLKLTMP